MKVLVDTNVLLDVAQQRAPFFASSQAVVEWCARHPGQGFVAWHSLSNIYFVLEKAIDDQAARDFIDLIVSIFEVAQTGTAAAKSALRLPVGDFEDALQVAAAVAIGADVIVTRNLRDYAGSIIPATDPNRFLASHRP